MEHSLDLKVIFVIIIFAIPKHAEKFVIIRLNWNEPESGFNVGLSQKTALPEAFYAFRSQLCIVTNWRLKSSFEIEELMLVVLDFGNER